MTLTLPVATLWLTLAAAGATPPPAPLLYDLTPLSGHADALQEAWAQRHAPKGATAELQRLLEAPDEARAEIWRDPHTLSIARWLLADEQLRRGDLESAMSHAEALRQAGSSLIDPLIGPLIEQLDRGKRAEDAGRWGYARTHPGAEMVEEILVASERLTAQGAPTEALTLIRAQLRRSLAVRTRRALTLRAAELEVSTGDPKAAITRLRRLWWETSSADLRRKLAKRLKTLGAEPGALEELAELAFETRRKDAKAVRRTLQRRRKRTRPVVTQRVIIWARALIAGLERDDREESEEVVAKYTRKLRGTEAEPWALVGHAKALRRLDKDVAAAEVYEDMATRFPAHPLTGHALVEAAGLYARHGLPSEAEALYRRVVSLDQHGEAEREALWQVGFAAFLRGEDDAAIAHLQRLIVGYEGERDGLGVTWTERGQYWWARAEVRRGNLAEAARLYDALIYRFPLGWYALLAAQQRQGLPEVPLGTVGELPPPFSGLQIVRRPALDYPVALMRLGEHAAARDVLKAMWSDGQLVGSGRALLAALYRLEGKEEQAARLLRRHAILAQHPSPADTESYAPLFAYKFDKLVTEKANAEGISTSVLAGLIHVESRFNPKARSGAGAVGLTQLMPGTARRISKRLYGRPTPMRRVLRPATNLTLGANLVRRLMNRFGDQLVPTMAAYNAGPGASTSWLRRRGHLPSDAWVETIPYDQTRRYVMRVISSAEIYRRLYGIAGPPATVPMDLPRVLGAFDDNEREGSNEAEPTPSEPAP